MKVEGWKEEPDKSCRRSGGEEWFSIHPSVFLRHPLFGRCGDGAFVAGGCEKRHESFSVLSVPDADFAVERACGDALGRVAVGNRIDPIGMAGKTFDHSAVAE